MLYNNTKQKKSADRRAEDTLPRMVHEHHTCPVSRCRRKDHTTLFPLSQVPFLHFLPEFQVFCRPKNGPQGCCAVPSTDQHGKGLPFAGRLYFSPFPWQRAKGAGDRAPRSKSARAVAWLFPSNSPKKACNPHFSLDRMPPVLYNNTK